MQFAFVIIFSVVTGIILHKPVKFFLIPLCMYFAWVFRYLAVAFNYQEGKSNWIVVISLAAYLLFFTATMIFFNTENKINFKLTFKNLKTVAIFLPILLLPYLIIKAPGIKNVYLHGFSMNICINIILLLGAGILEEALFRFYLLDIVRRFSPKIIAVIIIAVFYSVFHYSLSVDREWYVYIYFIIFSIILSVIRFDAKNLFFNGFIHFFVNLLFNYL